MKDIKERSVQGKRLGFGALIVLTVAMAVATFVEHSRGTAAAREVVYFSWWFAALWAICAVAGLSWLRRRAGKRFHLWLLHGSLVVILLGAGLSWCTSRSGQVHLRQGETAQAYLSEEKGHPQKALPFKLTLERFERKIHEGTSASSDYVSQLCVELPNERSRELSVSMNHPGRIGGWKLFQTSYDSDEQGSLLSLRFDPVGEKVTYVGYFLLLCSLIYMLCSKRGGFRRALKRSRQRAGMLVLGLVCASGLHALPTLPDSTAALFGKLYVEYDGRICQMQSLAQDFCLKVHGSTSYKGLSAEQVMTGFIFWSEEWNKEPFIEVKSRALRQKFNLKRQSTFYDFFLGNYRLGPLLQSSGAAGSESLIKGAMDADEKIMLIYSLRRGSLFKVFPLKKIGSGDEDAPVWMAPTNRFEGFVATGEARIFVDGIFRDMYAAAKLEDFEGVRNCILAIAKFQLSEGGSTIPSKKTTVAERRYNAIDVPGVLSKLNLLLGLLLFVWQLLNVRAGRLKSRLGERLIEVGSFAVLVAGWVGLTYFIALRTMVSGRLPFGNGFETMLSVAWFSILAGVILRLAKGLPVGFSFLVSGFFLLVASLSEASSGLGPLQPVLSSPLLSLHVSIIMMAYALLAFTFVCSLTALLSKASAERLQILSTLILYPAVVLLVVGIFIGAVWGNLSWGRYWGWDAKEVWALITFIVYVFPLHNESFQQFRKAKTFHVYLALAFLTVLMTYFGVNYFLGGLHSYA